MRLISLLPLLPLPPLVESSKAIESYNIDAEKIVSQNPALAEQLEMTCKDPYIARFLTTYTPGKNTVRKNQIACIAALVRAWEANGDRHAQRLLQHTENQNTKNAPITSNIKPLTGLRSQRVSEDPSKVLLPPGDHWLKVWKTWRMLLPAMPPSSGPYYSCEEDNAINPETLYSFAKRFVAAHFCDKNTGILVYPRSLPNLGIINDKPLEAMYLPPHERFRLKYQILGEGILYGREMANRTSFDCRIVRAQLNGHRKIEYNFSNLPPHYTQDPNHLPNVEIDINVTYRCKNPQQTHNPIPVVVQTKLRKIDIAKLKRAKDFTPSLCPPPPGDSRHKVCDQQHITIIDKIDSEVESKFKDEV